MNDTTLPVPEWRQRRASEMCRRVAVALGREAPAGLGHWEPAWEIVNGPSGAFLDALKQWERTGNDDAKTEVQRTAEAVLLAWREAARQWERAGRPRPGSAGADFSTTEDEPCTNEMQTAATPSTTAAPVRSSPSR